MRRSETSVDSESQPRTFQSFHGVEEVARSNRVAPTRILNLNPPRGWVAVHRVSQLSLK